MRRFIAILFTISIPFGLAAQWQQTNGPEGGFADNIIKVADYVFVNGGSGGVFRSADDGLTWKPVNNGLPDYPIVMSSHILVKSYTLPYIRRAFFIHMTLGKIGLPSTRASITSRPMR